MCGGGGGGGGQGTEVGGAGEGGFICSSQLVARFLTSCSAAASLTGNAYEG